MWDTPLHTAFIFAGKTTQIKKCVCVRVCRLGWDWFKKTLWVIYFHWEPGWGRPGVRKWKWTRWALFFSLYSLLYFWKYFYILHGWFLINYRGKRGKGRKERKGHRNHREWKKLRMGFEVIMTGNFSKPQFFSYKIGIITGSPSQSSFKHLMK